ncbi:hypothetical protein JNM87_01135 [Candidatus Saccharibacteria bacterium]|nr:hypothetical protein [Candidatus Saccharibacteria bacterium]
MLKLLYQKPHPTDHIRLVVVWLPQRYSLYISKTTERNKPSSAIAELQEEGKLLEFSPN